MKKSIRVPILISVSLVVLTTFILVASLRTARGQSTYGNIMSYSASNDWVLFTDQTGTWHAPLAITNSAAPSDSVIEFTVNTDDQFVLQAYGGGTPKSFLDVDVDGSASLYGSSGGGVGVDAATGDTCLPSTVDRPCGASSLHINSNGVFTQYQGQPTAGNGLPAILYYADATAETGSFGPYTIFTTGASGYGAGGMYRLTGYMTSTVAAPGSTMRFVVSYADETGSKSQSTGLPTAFQSAGDFIPFSFVFYCVPNTPIAITTVAAGGTPTYTVHLRLEAL